MDKRAAAALREVLLVTLGLGIGAAILVHILHVVTFRREESRRIHCRNHLNCNAKAMATYLNECGNNLWYPWPMGRGLRPDGFTGAEWFATNYWVRIHPTRTATFAHPQGTRTTMGATSTPTGRCPACSAPRR